MFDAHAATELKLYIDNDGDLYRRQTMLILRNLATKRAQRVYNHDLAVKLFGYLTEEGAKKYAREFGSAQPWHQMFDVATLRQVAEELTRDFEAEAALGNYDHLLPKKYQGQQGRGARVQKKISAKQHARKKLNWKTPESVKIVWSPVNQAYLALWPGHGRIENQGVLKIANAEEMHGWLRDTYGEAYGIASPGAGGARKRGVSAHARKKFHSGVSAKDIREFRGFLQNASDVQVQGIYEKEHRAGREAYAELARAEAEDRGISLGGDRHHARWKSSAQLDHDIATVLDRRSAKFLSRRGR